MAIKNVICDIDGVLMHDNVAVPGAAEFLTGILEKGLPLVLLTNYPSQTGQDLANRFATAGVNVPDSVFYTSAMATADFLRRQEGKKAYVVGDFAIQWLGPRLTSFNSAYPGIDVRIQAVDRQEDKLADDVDVAIFYGRGNWPGLRVEKLYAEYLLPVCSPLLLTGDKALKTPADLAQHTLLHDASRRDWQTYTRQLGLSHINVQQGPIFSHSAMVLQAAIHGQGVALANNVMAQSEIEAGRLVCPFNDVLVSKNAFYLVCHDSQAELGKIAAFRQWILAKAASEQEKFRFRYEQ